MKILSYFFVGCVYIYNLSNKKVCVYNKKKTCVFMCVYGVVLINILVLQLGPPKQKFLAPPLAICFQLSKLVNWKYVESIRWLASFDTPKLDIKFGSYKWNIAVYYEGHTSCINCFQVSSDWILQKLKILKMQSNSFQDFCEFFLKKSPP